MSFVVMSEVWDRAPLAGTQLLVALALADNANKESRQAWPSVTRLAERCRVSSRWVRQTLRAMEGAGMIEAQKRPGTSTVYTFTDPTKWAATPEQSSDLPRNTVPDGTQFPSEPQFRPPRNPSSGDPGTPVPPNHKEPLENPTPSRQAALLPVPVPMKAEAGWTYSRTLGEWASVNGHPPPDEGSRADIARWLIGVLHRTLDVDTDDRRAAARGRVAAVIGDYIAAADEPLRPEGWQMLGRHLKTARALEVLESVIVAIDSGAGIDEKWKDDPKALMLYALKVRSGESRAAA